MRIRDFFQKLFFFNYFWTVVHIYKHFLEIVAIHSGIAFFENSVFIFGKKSTPITCCPHRKRTMIWNRVNVSVSVCLQLRNKVKHETASETYFLPFETSFTSFHRIQSVIIQKQTASNDTNINPLPHWGLCRVFKCKALFLVSEIPGVSSTTDGIWNA